MIIKAFAAVAALGLLSAGPCLAQAIYEKPVETYAPPMPAAEKSFPQAKTAAAEDATVRADGAVYIDGQLRIPVNADVAAKVGIPIEIVASSPVPDTPANRALYGGPMSNGGARTAPAGN
jgi:hypothetical protein